MDISARAAATTLNVSLSTIYRRCRAGVLTAVKTAGRWVITIREKAVKRIFTTATTEIRIIPADWEPGSYRVIKAETTGSGAGIDRWTISGDQLELQIANILGHGFIEVTA